MDFEHVDSLITDAKTREFVYVAGGAGSAVIKQVEKEMGVTFCKDYVEYLRKYGSIGVGEDQLAGIIMDYFSDTSGGDVRFETSRFTSETGLALDNKTVLLNFSGEGYVVLDHSNGSVLLYDPFSKKYHSYANDLEGAIEVYFNDHS